MYKLYHIVSIMILKCHIVSIMILCCSLFFSVSSCSTIKYVPIKGEDIYHTEYVVKDSIVYIPQEIIRDVVPQLDTLVLESSLAKSISYVDTTTYTLKGKLENKKEIIHKDRIIYRDSIVVQKQEVPVPVEVEKKVIPKWCYYSLGANIFILLLIIGRLIIKLYFKK